MTNTRWFVDDKPETPCQGHRVPRIISIRRLNDVPDAQRSRKDHLGGDGHDVSLDSQRLTEIRYLPDPASEDPFADSFQKVMRGELPLSSTAIVLRWPSGDQKVRIVRGFDGTAK